jgi:hypothetical protein
MRQLSGLFFAVAVLGSAVASAQGWNPDFRNRMGDEIRANEMRAQALNPIIARNTQARNDMMADFQQLMGEAHGMHDRANWFRMSASGIQGRFRDHFMHQADELDRNAQRNEQLAAGQKDLAARLDATIRSLDELRLWHIESARVLRESLMWQ